jgi:hypothetical protein
MTDSILTHDDFQKSSPELASSPAPENFKFEFEREDWTLFRTVEGLQQKAGVPKQRLRRLALKELVDNALDTGATVKAGVIDGGYYVEDLGPGIDPEQVPRLFSIARPLVSTKLLRLPMRGALGNGLRVVAGAVLASEGSLVVLTRNRRIVLRPERDGSTTVVETSAIGHPVGTRIEIGLGPALPPDQAALAWAQLACHLAQGTTYGGRSSPWWYDPSQFHELLYAGGDRPVRELITNLDGCTGGNAGIIVAAAKLNRVACKNVTREQATDLLEAARLYARSVKPERLGAVGPGAYPYAAYTMSSGVAKLGSVAPLAEIPFVVEMWAGKIERSDTNLRVFINRTPITGQIDSARDKRDIDAYGLVYIEKEGFSEALKDVRWAERHDCALLSSKGFSTRARPGGTRAQSRGKRSVRKPTPLPGCSRRTNVIKQQGDPWRNVSAA